MFKTTPGSISRPKKHLYQRHGHPPGAHALSESGQLLMYFNIQREGNQIHVLNAPSPGAPSSLAIPSYILEHYLGDLG